MDCLIEVDSDGDVQIVRVAGRLTEAQVPDLLAVSTVATGFVWIDLVHLVSVDSIALEALRRVRASGAAVINAPPFIQLMLDSSFPQAF